jgi:general secretion pathway protein K
MLTRLTKRLRIPSGKDGFIIVAVLWILAALATLATIISVYVINAANAFTVHDERLQAEALTRAAIELSVYNIARDAQAVPTRGSFVFQMGNASVATEFNSELARIDLNAASKPLLTGLFVGLGTAPATADYYADRITGWRTAPAEGTADENSLYRAAGLTYGPRGGPFQHVGELSLVLGIPEFLIERATPYLTVYSGQGQINIMDAAPQVIAALPRMSPELLNTILQQRERAPQNAPALLAMLGPGTLGALSGSKSVRITSRITFDSGQRVTSEVVIFILDSGTEAYRVLTWRDDIDG